MLCGCSHLCSANGALLIVQDKEQRTDGFEHKDLHNSPELQELEPRQCHEKNMKMRQI